MSKKETNKYLKQKQVYQPHDKTFRKVLLNKTQAVELLNNYFEFENKIKEENIERYNCKFVNAQFRNKEIDILYKERMI